MLCLLLYFIHYAPSASRWKDGSSSLSLFVISFLPFQLNDMLFTVGRLTVYTSHRLLETKPRKHDRALQDTELFLTQHHQPLQQRRAATSSLFRYSEAGSSISRPAPLGYIASHSTICPIVFSSKLQNAS